MAELRIATLNTRGAPLSGSQLAERYAAIGRFLEAGPIDVIALQEVHTYVHLGRLTTRMPSFRYVSYRAGLAGPAGGLVTLARRTARTQAYRRFPLPAAAPGLPHSARLLSLMKGVLSTRVARPDLRVVNVHPTANRDADWSGTNRFAGMHRQQLDVVARIVQEESSPVVVCGDFNISRDSELHRGFLADAGLADVFGNQCPPTFHPEYLPEGRSAHCIDFLLTRPPVRAREAQLMLTGKVELSDGSRTFLSDHLGLRATLDVP